MLLLFRTNPSRIRFNLFELNKDKTIIKIVGTEKQITVNHPIENVSAWWYKWTMNGEYLQDAFKAFSDCEREFILTGITPEEWKKIFPPEESEH